MENNEFNESIKQKYLYQQQFFCENKIISNNTLIESEIKSVKVKFNNKTFDMFVYKKNDIVSSELSNKGYWEYYEAKSILHSLLYYSKKMNITPKDIYILDIGANIGWYSLILGKNGLWKVD